MARERIPIISLWMPWAQWVILGWKPIETRTHRRFAGLAGRWIGIHATEKWDDNAVDAARPWLRDWQVKLTDNFGDIHGAILGRAACTVFRPVTQDDEREALIECRSVQRYGLVLAYPTVMTPIPAKGKQGIWYHDALTVDAL